MENISYIIVISILINLLIQAGLILRYYYPLLLEYFNNKKINWNPNHDRIIAVAFIMCLLLTVYFSQILLQFSKGSHFIILYLSVLVILTFFVFLIQKMGNTKRTKNILIIPTQGKKNLDFENLFTQEELEKIFNKLMENDFIEVIKNNEDILDKNLFTKILSEGILPYEPIFKLNMDNIQTKQFHKLFKIKCKRLSIPMFLKIFNIKSETATPASISSSNSKNLNGAKKKDLIESIFLG